MIKVTDMNGKAHYLSPANIARVTEAGASSQWHGIRAVVRTFDGATLEAQETAASIAKAIEQGDAKEGE